MLTLATEVCRNCLFREEAEEVRPCAEHECHRNPAIIWLDDVDKYWCGEFRQAWMPLGEPKRVEGTWIQQFVHRRLEHTFVFKDTKTGECFTEEEYRGR